MAKYNPVVHFEMPYVNRKRAVKFYEKAFGWKMKELGKDMGYYVMAQTAATGRDRMVKTPGTINGGFYQKTADRSRRYGKGYKEGEGCRRKDHAHRCHTWSWQLGVFP
jgi:hypothetical protein